MDGCSGHELLGFFYSKGYREMPGQYRIPGQVLLTQSDDPLESPVNIPEAQEYLGPEFVKRVLGWAGFTVGDFEHWRTSRPSTNG